MGKTDKLIRMTDVKGFTLKNITIHSKYSTVLIDDGRNILFEQVHFQIPGGKVKIKTQGDLAKEPQFVRCLMNYIHKKIKDEKVLCIFAYNYSM